MNEKINETSIEGGGGWHNPPSLLELVAERDRYKAALILTTESLDDLLHHGFKYSNGTIHEANPEIAKQALEKAKEALNPQPKEVVEDNTWSNEGGYSGCGWESDAC